MYVIAVYRRQVASHRRSDGSVSTPSTQVRCVMLIIEVSRRRASRFYARCRQRVGCTTGAGARAMRCVIAVCKRQTASQRRADGYVSTLPTQLRCVMLIIEVSRRRGCEQVLRSACRQRVGCRHRNATVRARLRPDRRCLSIVGGTRHHPVLGQPLVCRAATLVVAPSFDHGHASQPARPGCIQPTR